MTEWLEIARGDAPLLVSLPHTGTELPPAIAAQLRSPWLARKDADHWVHLLHDFARDLGATTLRTAISRSAIDVNRDPSGQSLYPGQFTTELCPLHTFDGEPLYPPGGEPDAAEIARRRTTYFEPYHVALAAEIARLRARHPHVVLYDAHSIRSRVPRLFEGELPQLNVGTYDGRSCAPELARRVAALCEASSFSWVLNGRFKGGWTTRHYGRPNERVSALQMELAYRSYAHEPPAALTEANWPSAYDAAHAQPLRRVLAEILDACLEFAGRNA